MCGKEFFEKALFRRHVKKATHGKKGRVKQNLERECEHCGRKFTQLREYRRHINNHQGERPNAMGLFTLIDDFLFQTANVSLSCLYTSL